MSTNEAKTGPLSATTVTATGAVSSASVAATGAVSGATVSATGAVSGASVAATGAVSGATVSATGAVSGASVAATGAVTGASLSVTGAVSGASLSVSGELPFRKVRAVCTSNVSNLSSFNVSANTDGVTLVENDIVLLIAQTTAAQNGPYVVGTVTMGSAPLTRPAWFAAGATIKSGYALEIGGEGSVFKNTTWKTMVASDSFVVDTTDGKFYPRMVSGQANLGSGAATITTVPIFSTLTNVVLTRTSPSGTSSTVEYALNGTPTAGTIGTGSFSIRAALASGSVNTSDTSTITWTVINQG